MRARGTLKQRGLLHASAAKTDRDAALTWPGQAHWGGSGPRGKTCRECQHWHGGGPGGYYEATNSLRDATCQKFADTMTLKPANCPKVPHSALACRHFEQNAAPPKIHKE